MEINTFLRQEKQKHSAVINNHCLNGKKIRIKPLQEIISPLAHALT